MFHVEHGCQELRWGGWDGEGFLAINLFDVPRGTSLFRIVAI